MIETDKFMEELIDEIEEKKKLIREKMEKLDEQLKYWSNVQKDVKFVYSKRNVATQE